jgi:hypothetical protein
LDQTRPLAFGLVVFSLANPDSASAESAAIEVNLRSIINQNTLIMHLALFIYLPLCAEQLTSLPHNS